MAHTTISELRDIANTYRNYERRRFTVRGSVRSVEDDGTRGALYLADESCEGALRIAYQRYYMPSSCGNNTFEQVNEAVDRGALSNYDAVASCKPGDAVEATGVLMLTPDGPEPFELWSDKVEMPVK